MVASRFLHEQVRKQRQSKEIYTNCQKPRPFERLRSRALTNVKVDQTATQKSNKVFDTAKRVQSLTCCRKAMGYILESTGLEIGFFL